MVLNFRIIPAKLIFELEKSFELREPFGLILRNESLTPTGQPLF